MIFNIRGLGRMVVLLALLAAAFHFDAKPTSLLGQEFFQDYVASSLPINDTMISTNTENNDISGLVGVLKMWNEYKQQHSHFALLEETAGANSTDRKFAVAYYSCPLQAGNRLHHFMNSLIWAIITNRTVLWKYYDKQTCLQVGHRYGQSICQAANDEKDCSKILKRAKWLPSLDAWSSTLNLSTPSSLSYWTTHEPSTKHKFWFKGAEREAGLADSTLSRLVNFPQMLGQDAWILHSERKRKMLLTTGEARRRAELLFQKGADFVYGLLFLDVFAFQPSVSVPATEMLQSYPTPASENVTIVVHSRHSNSNDDGAMIKREVQCLDRVLKNNVGFCQVMILSDRPKTLRAVAGYLNYKYAHCRCLVAPHDLGSSFLKEHGPYSGSGFYQDLAMVSNQILHVPTSKTAFVGSKHRSSSQLVREVVTFQQQQIAHSRNISLELITCYLEEIDSHPIRSL